MADTVLSLPPRRAWWLRLLHNRAAAAGVLVIVIGVFLSLAGPPLYAGLLPSDQRHFRDGIYQDYNAINEGPSALHWFGADYLGRDVLTRLLTAIRVSLTVALVVEAINIGVGGTLGLIAGYF